MADHTSTRSTRVEHLYSWLSLLLSFAACADAAGTNAGAATDNSAGAASPAVAVAMPSMAAATTATPSTAMGSARTGAAAAAGPQAGAMNAASGMATMPAMGASQADAMAAAASMGAAGASAPGASTSATMGMGMDMDMGGAAAGASAPASAMDVPTDSGMATETAEGQSEGHEDLGMGDGSDVVTVGDSWMSYAANGGGIETGLLAASGQPYRTYGLAGTMLLDEVIPNQYETAKRQNPDIKTVVMTGGGNDLLLTGMTVAGCGSGCMSTIDRVTQRLKEMWDEMAMDGVQDVIYVEYSRGGTNEPGVSYANEVIPPVCAAAPVRCHFIDSDLIIDKVLLDGVHPTADGCRKLGQAIYDLMIEKGMRR